MVKARGDWDIRLEREPKAPVVKFLLLSVCSQVQESQATIAPAPAGSSSDPASAGHSTSRSQGIIEPMDAETQEDRRMSVDQKTGGEKNTEVDRKMQVDGRTQGDQTEASRRWPLQPVF